jgi:inosose dehydratase
MSMLDRVAGAPISWGVCEVAGWGLQLPADRVFEEMRALGLRATEVGPEGFLPGDPVAKVRVLAAAGLAAVGGFVPLVLHDPAHDPLPEISRALDSLLSAGARVAAIAAAACADGYDRASPVDTTDWSALLRNLDRIADFAEERGVTAALHPHVGTLVEGPDDVGRVLAGSRIKLCVDTGHLVVGGVDPVDLVREAPERVAHVHLKDVDLDIAQGVGRGEGAYADAVRHGLFRPLGYGGVDIGGVVRALEASGYGGWYVLEQDTILTCDPKDEGPAADVRTSLEFLRGIA